MRSEQERAQAAIRQSRYNDDNRESSTVFHDLLKAKKRPAGVPAGFSFIPKSKHQGYRKRKGDHWIYWYPDQHRHEDHIDWEDDLGAGTGTGAIKPGQFVAIIGRPGTIFAWTPDARAAKPGKTWVTPVDPDDGHTHGKPVLVDDNQLQAQKSYDPDARRKRRRTKKRTASKRVAVGTSASRMAARKKRASAPKKPGTRGKKRQSQQKKPGRAANPEAALHRRRMARYAELLKKIAEAKELLSRTGRKRIRSAERIARIKVAIVDAQESLINLGDEVAPGDYTPTEEARTVVFEDSRADPKTNPFLHRLENGYYPLLAFEANDKFIDEGTGKRIRTTGVFIPPQDVKGLFEEFGPLQGATARDISNKYRIRTPEGRQDVLSGAKLGLMLALRSYSGGTPFAVHAQRYANVYAMHAARDVMGGGATTIPARQMQMLHGLIAARARSFSKHGESASVEQIAKEWRIGKKQTFTGRSSTLGKYVRTATRGKSKGKQIVVDQSTQPTPMEDWQVVKPDGTKVGKKHMGKLSLVQAMMPLLDGNRVNDTEWMNQHEGSLIPLGADQTMPLGLKHGVRSKIDDIMENMSDRNREVLSVLYGLDNSPFEARGQSTANVRGENYAVNAEDLATILGLADAKSSRRDKQRKAKAAVELAEAEFRKEASDLGYDDVGKRSKSWNRLVSSTGPELKIIDGPSHRDLAERFGGDDRVHIYATAIRSGEAEKVAKLLDQWKAGKLRASARGKLLRDHQKRRDAERLATFRRQTAHRVVDLDEVSEPARQTSPDSVALYTDEILMGAAQAIVNGAADGRPLRPRRNSRSKVWDEGRFQRYMGRAEQYVTAQGGDND